jgi:nicotinamidase-related amidase
MIPLPIESLFRSEVDVSEPYDRTTTVAELGSQLLERDAMQHRRNLRIPDTLADACDPDRMALVVYDMQVGVVRQLADGPQVTERVLRVLEAARRAELRIFFTRHMTLPTDLMGISQLRTAMAWQRKDRVEEIDSPFLRDSPGFELVRELAPLASEAVFDKLAMSAFEGTPLEFVLRDAQVTAFAIVATEVGIEPTVRHGADLGLIPVVVTDACGAGNHAAAKRSLDALATAGDAILTDSATITGLLTRPTTGDSGPRGPEPPRELSR